MARKSVESQSLPDVSRLVTDVQEVKAVLSLQIAKQAEEALARSSQALADANARHVAELAQVKEMSDLKGGFLGVEKAVAALTTETAKQSTDLKKLDTLESSVKTLQEAHVQNIEDRRWLKRTLGGILLAMIVGPLLAWLALANGYRIPSEPADSAILHADRDRNLDHHSDQSRNSEGENR